MKICSCNLSELTVSRSSCIYPPVLYLYCRRFSWMFDCRFKSVYLNKKSRFCWLELGGTSAIAASVFSCPQALPVPRSSPSTWFPCPVDGKTSVFGSLRFLTDVNIPFMYKKDNRDNEKQLFKHFKLAHDTQVKKVKAIGSIRYIPKLDRLSCSLIKDQNGLSGSHVDFGTWSWTLPSKKQWSFLVVP